LHPAPFFCAEVFALERDVVLEIVEVGTARWRWAGVDAG
jgi:hypothetical protein